MEPANRNPKSNFLGLRLRTIFYNGITRFILWLMHLMYILQINFIKTNFFFYWKQKKWKINELSHYNKSFKRKIIDFWGLVIDWKFIIQAVQILKFDLTARITYVSLKVWMPLGKIMKVLALFTTHNQCAKGYYGLSFIHKL